MGSFYIIQTPSYIIKMEQLDLNWYHGKISRDEAERILRDQGIRDGAFLVRESNSSEGDYVLSVLYQNVVTHYQIRRHQDDSFFSIDEKSPIHGLDQLIEHYRHYQGGLVTTLSVIVRNSPPPQKDLLNGKSHLLHRTIKGIRDGNVTLLKNVISDKTRNMEAKDEDGRTAVHLACVLGIDEAVTTLLTSQRHVSLKTRDICGNTPLHYACSKCSVETVNLMIEKGADIQARNPQNGHVPLHEAASAGRLEIVQLLLQKNIPHMPRTHLRQFPAQLAAENGHKEVALFLSGFRMTPPMTSRFQWFHGTLERQDSVQKLQEKLRELERGMGTQRPVISPFETGVYLVRSSDTMDNKKKISLLFENVVKHFVIDETLLEGKRYFYIDEGPFLPSLEHLIEHYQRYADGLPTNLRYNVVPPETPEVDTRTIPRSNRPKMAITTPSPVQTLPKKVPETPPSKPKKSPLKNMFTLRKSKKGSASGKVDAKTELAEEINKSPMSSIQFESNFCLNQLPPMTAYEAPREPRPIDDNHYTQDDTKIMRDLNANCAYTNAQVSIIPNRKLTLSERLGEGEFGCVYRGFYEYRGKEIEVAIKTLNKDHCEADRRSFLAEAEIMMNLHHPCIVRLIGVSEDEPTMIVQELVPLGAMLNYLQTNHDNITNIELKYLAVQIASGMNYLVNKHFVHRDLAARNILLQSRVLAKISDFGLSRCFSKDKDYYKASEGGKWPVKWYSPESYFQAKFSHASDVWSFGVVLWEMYSRGAVPYGDSTTGSQAIEKIERGERLERPEKCPLDVYQIMLSCWEREPKRRPTFQSLFTFFQRLHFDSSGWRSSLTDVELANVHDTDSEYLTIHDLAITVPIDQNFNQPQTRQPLIQRDRQSMMDRVADYFVNEDEIVVKATGFEDFLEAEWKNCNVVVKPLSPGYVLDQEEEKVMNDLLGMVKLSHSAVVKFMGIVVRDPKMLVFEHVGLGSMLSYLQSNSAALHELNLWAFQIADGMSYLCNKQVIHRNLSARTVFLQSRNQAKICFLGLSEEEPTAPWCAPEVLEGGSFSAASATWSFGVTLWEMYSHGNVPYEGMSETQVTAFVQSGNRLLSPKSCPVEIYNTMLKCWTANPEDRTSFGRLTAFFKDLEQVEDSIDYVSPVTAMETEQDALNANSYCSMTSTDKVIEISDVTKERKLGGGEFGTVYAGHFYSRVKKAKVPVAIKTLNPDKAGKYRDAFLAEFSVMINLNHPNIIRLIGIVSGPPLMIVQELATDNLLDYIKKHRNSIAPEIELKLWAYQVASGMHYLVSKRFVHRDLAARNILLVTKLQAKISDFGLSRVYNCSEDEYQASTGGLWPFKWYPPESFTFGRFLPASDVWSYAVFLWEIYTFGEVPYGDMGNEDYVKHIESGHRLSQPQACPLYVYNVMQRCWFEEPSKRPKFSELMDFFAHDYLYQNIQEIGFNPVEEILVPNIINV